MFSILTCMVLVLTFLRAPFMHDHEHAENDSHPGGLFHTHFAHIEKPSNTHQFRDFDPDDDARDQHWFAAVSTHFELPMALPVRLKSFEMVSVLELYVQGEIESGHDPPHLLQTSPRGPPL